MKARAFGLLLAFAVATGAAFAIEHEAASPVVKARQSEMRAMSAAAKAISEFFSGKRPYDASEFRRNADAISRRAGEHLVLRFATTTEAAGSDAKPEIAADHVKFADLADQLEVYANRLEDSAEEGMAIPPSMRMKASEAIEGGPFAKKRDRAPEATVYSSEHAFHMMLQTCTSCHAAFRLKR